MAAVNQPNGSFGLSHSFHPDLSEEQSHANTLGFDFFGDLFVQPSGDGNCGNTQHKAHLPGNSPGDQTDEYFGVKVPDPYRWLEADIRESHEVAAWAKKQNDVAREYLDSIPERAALKKRLPTAELRKLFVGLFAVPQYQARHPLPADTDDRVVPMNSFKYGAAMQRAQSSDAPILLRVETRSGHGAGTPLDKRIEKATPIGWPSWSKSCGWKPLAGADQNDHDAALELPQKRSVDGAVRPLNGKVSAVSENG